MGVLCQAAAGMMDSPHLPEHIHAVPGAIVEDLGTVYPVTNQVVVHISLFPLHKLSTFATNKLHLLKNWSRRLGDDPRLTDYQISMGVALNSTIAQLESFVKPPPQHRYRRGLVDFIGVMAHGLFGLVDEATLTDKLKEYRADLNTVVHSFNASAHAINALNDNVNRLSTAYDTMQSSLMKTLEVASNNNQAALEMAFNMVQVQMAFGNTLKSCSDLMSALVLAARGIVLPTLISPHDIKAILKDLAAESLTPLFPLSRRALFYSNLKSYLTEQGVSLVIPLYPEVVLTAQCYTHSRTSSTDPSIYW